MAIPIRLFTGLLVFVLAFGAFAQSETNPQPLDTADTPAESADINEFDNEDFFEFIDIG
jgi:hypothetical protein